MDKREATRQLADVRRLLIEWDAIGVADAIACQDEYDCMIGPLLGHLRDGADAVFLRDWIARERVDHFDLNANLARDRAPGRCSRGLARRTVAMDGFTEEDYEAIDRACGELLPRGRRKDKRPEHADTIDTVRALLRWLC